MAEGALRGRYGKQAMNETAEAVDPHLHGRRRFIFFICAIALFMASVDSTIVATALPKIGSSLHARLNWLGWTITIYSLGQVVMLPIAGRISDQIGRKQLFVTCVLVFTLASVACGLSTNIYMLVPLRLLQSMGGGGFLPSASGIVSDHFGRDRDRALGLFSSIFPMGSVAGPIFGGLITQYWNWRGIFFVNLPIGLALAYLIMRYIPATQRSASRAFDGLGIALLAATIVSVMLAITDLGELNSSLASPSVYLPGLIGIAFGSVFLRHLRRCEYPIISPSLLYGRGFGALNCINVMFGGAGFGFGALVPLYAENRYRISESSAGTVLSAQAIGMVIVAFAASMLIRRTGYRRPMTIGFLFVALSLIMLSIGARGISAYWWLLLFSMLTGLGLGSIAPAANNATLQLAPTQVAEITGLRGMFRQSGSILSISITTAILARSKNPGIVQSHIFWVLAIILLFAALLSSQVSDTTSDSIEIVATRIGDD